ncbi:MAG TPA: Mu transposase C-terminal domain-containing protein [Pseudomonadales bacterium]|nr:Mu transposase C-terminal domain-containing protein [Pseudomonadales bacterium]
MTENADKLFTAAQIAAAIGVTPQRVRQRLRGITPAGKKFICGNETAAFALDDLPASLREQLEDVARRQNFSNAAALLSTPRAKWEPALPMDKIAEENIQAAAKLRDAFRPWLIQRDDLSLNGAEMEAAGVEDYRRIFGNRITTRYWRELFMRTIRRDNGAEEWNRIEIYLPDRLKRKALPADAVLAALDDDLKDFSGIDDFITACGNPHAPSETERRGVWTLVLEKYAALVNAGDTEKSAARRVRDYIFQRASFLAASRNALWMAFDRKLAAFKKGNGDPKALRDGRSNNGERFTMPENDLDLLIHRAVFTYRGDVAPAWRDCLHEGFSTEVKARYAGKALDKSHVPAKVMDAVAPQVEILTVMYQGRRAFDAIKGHVTRNYDGISSLQCMSADDFTLNTYFYVPDGNGWYQLTRGQVILFIDFRTLKILGWALEPRKSYSSMTIRSLCTHIFSRYGVPQVLYFERGLWKSATLLKGKKDPFTFSEISQGLREFGIKFIHAIRPRTKAIERIGGMLQDIAEAEPGYCGRDERHDAPESLRRQMAEVEARKVEPSKNFYSYDQWNERIGQLVDRYNAEQQQGHILAGMSPDQAFDAHLNFDDPPIQFSADLRYLLAHDKRVATVTLNGVTIQVGKQKFNYRGKEIAHLVGREVMVWFDPENPETIVVTDLDRQNPICVERSENPNALESLIEPGAGRLGRELSRIEGQAFYMKTRFNVVKAKSPLPTRLLLNSAQANDLGEEITRQRGEITKRKERNRRERQQAQKLTQRTGILVPDGAEKNITPEDAKFLSEYINNGNADSGTDYQLKPFKKFGEGKGTN